MNVNYVLPGYMYIYGLPKRPPVSLPDADGENIRLMHGHIIFSQTLTKQTKCREISLKFGKTLMINLSFYLSEPKPVQIVIPYESYSTSVILFVQTPDVGVFDGIHVLIEGGPNVTMPLKHDNKITVANLTPGTEYNFSVSAVSGTKFSNAYHVPAVKTCKYFRTCISFIFMLILCHISN